MSVVFFNHVTTTDYCQCLQSQLINFPNNRTERYESLISSPPIFYEPPPLLEIREYTPPSMTSYLGRFLRPPVIIENPRVYTPLPLVTSHSRKCPCDLEKLQPQVQVVIYTLGLGKIKSSSRYIGLGTWKDSLGASSSYLLWDLEKFRALLSVQA